MKQVLITGAGGGLGKIVSKKFLNQGYTVFGSVSPGNKGKDPITHENLKLHEIDLNNEQSVIEWFSLLNENEAKLAGIIMLAGGFSIGKIAETDESNVKQMLDRNFFTAYNISRQAVKYFADNKSAGSFIFISARPAINPRNGADFVAYTLSKSLLHTWSELILAEGKKLGVRTHIIVPNALDTEANKKNMPDADQSKWTKSEDIADLMVEIIENSGLKEGLHIL